MPKVLIHCKPSILEHLDALKVVVTVGTISDSDNEIDLIADDIPYEAPNDAGVYEDPDRQYCDRVGIDWDQINCIETLNPTTK